MGEKKKKKEKKDKEKKDKEKKEKEEEKATVRSAPDGSDKHASEVQTDLYNEPLSVFLGKLAFVFLFPSAENANTFFGRCLTIINL